MLFSCAKFNNTSDLVFTTNLSLQTTKFISNFQTKCEVSDGGKIGTLYSSGYIIALCRSLIKLMVSTVFRTIRIFCVSECAKLKDWVFLWRFTFTSDFLAK